MPARGRLRIAVAVALVAGLALLAALLLTARRTSDPVAALAAPGDPVLAPPRAAPPPRAPHRPLPLVAAPSASPGAGADVPAPPIVEGRVLSTETGLGIAGAEVTFSRAGAAAAARTGADGAFRLEAPVEGRWLLAAVTAPGFLPFAPEWGYSPVVVDARAGQAVRGVELRLSPARRLVGTVLGPDGAPVPGAEVVLLGVRSEAALVALADRFTTDAAGVFRFSAPRGTVVEARAPGLAPGRVEVDARALVERRLVVRLQAGKGEAPAPGRVAGRVVERGSGAPVAGALVLAERGTRFGVIPAGQAVSGPDGRFALSDLGDGPYRVSASADGRARAVVGPVAPGAEVTLELARGGLLRGCVQDGRTGAPVTTFTVTVAERRGEGRGPTTSRAFLDASGCWALDDVAPGPARVAVSAPGFVPAADVVVDVPESGEAAADVRLSRGRRFRGVVVDAERRTPIPDAHVELQSSSPDSGVVIGAAEEAWTDAQGRFELSGLARRFSLEVTAAGHHVRLAGGLEVAPGDDPAPVVIAVTPVAPGEEPQREITGIGVTIAPRDGGVVVTGVIPGGGAAAAGIGVGDVIVRVDGVPVAELGLVAVTNAIRGPEGTSVRLSIRRGDGSFDVWVGRAIVRG